MARIGTVFAALAMVVVGGSVAVGGTAQAAVQSRGALPDCAPADGGRVWVYEYPNYDQNHGWSWYRCTNENLAGHRFRYTNTHMVDNNIDSVYNLTDCWAVLYKATNLSGVGLVVPEHSGIPDLASYPDVGRNQTSSIEISC